MTTLYVKFGIFLSDNHLSPAHRREGPLFYRWLPDGEKDFISLATRDPSATLRVWFVRRGFIQNGQVEYAVDRFEIDPETMSRQCVLEAGPLIGILKLPNLDEEETRAVGELLIGTEAYVKIGKRVVKLIQPSVEHLTEVLRVYYGQYWLRAPGPWNSKRQSLGSYCSGTLQAQWSFCPEGPWKSFRPNESIVTEDAYFNTEEDIFKVYLTESDWQSLSKTLKNVPLPSIAALSLIRAHRLVNNKMIREGIVEAVLALELALVEFLRSCICHDKELLDVVGGLKLSLKSRAITIVSASGKATPEELKTLVSCIDHRNKIVHEGADIEASDRITMEKVRQLISIVGRLIPGPGFKFPDGNMGNIVVSANTKV